VQQQLLGGDALQRLADSHACDGMLQEKALTQHLELQGGVAADTCSMLGAAQDDRLD
jgi:hypothetical protein